MFNCKYCNRECKNKNSLVQHEIRCKENPNKIKVIGNPYNPGNKGHKGGNQYTKAKELGLPKPEISEETRLKLSIKCKINSNKYWSNPENKIKLSKSMKKAVREHPESYSSSNVNGRAKHIIYNGISLDSSWEYEVAKYLDNHNIKWIRPKNGFEYYWNNDNHIYYPDFYLPDFNLYIEVKGYERERDKIKYESVSNLIVLKNKEIEDIKQNKDVLKILAQGRGFGIPSS